MSANSAVKPKAWIVTCGQRCPLELKHTVLHGKKKIVSEPGVINAVGVRSIRQT
jgi:hypothetical protein